MKPSRQFVAVIFFSLIFVLPFIPVGISFMKIRSAVVVDQPVEWTQGKDQKILIPALEAGKYEIRLEARESKWDPVMRANWDVKKNSETVMGPEATEWNIMRPLATLNLAEKTQDLVLNLNFENSNPAKYPIRVKISRDREAMAQKGSNDLGLYLAISLVLTAIFWKPLISPRKPRQEKSGSNPVT